ncbi:aspartate and glycine-rich protein-like [Anneissia japonica]|uniref:aspartate and glycine-rich protein-like n=1 Tax=Anneissia japonica TaxID=1529436 RepID=UPI0014255B6A|nr:aspartate and glycine-rich protein-like [Anneissia japonica]
MKLTTLTISLIVCCVLLDGIYGNGYNLHRQKNENLRTPNLVRSHDVDTNGEDPWWDDENEYLSGDDVIRRLPDVMDDDPRSRTERVDYKDIKTSDKNYNGDWDDNNYENLGDNGNRDIQEKSNFDDDGDWDDEQVKYESFKSDGNRYEDEKENYLDVQQEDDDRWNEQELARNNYEDNDNYNDYWAQQEYNSLDDDGWDQEQNYDTKEGNLEYRNVDDVDYGDWGVFDMDYGDRPTGVSNDNNFDEGRYKRQLSAVNSEKEGSDKYDFEFVEGEESSMDDSGCRGTECIDEREDGGSDSSSDYFIT